MENRLVKLKLRGFKSVADAEIGFNRLNVLIGANGSGKSNLIEFFHLLSYVLASPSGALQRYVVQYGGGANRLLHDGAKRTPQIESEIELETEQGRNDYRFRLFHAAPDTLLFADEACRFSRKGMGLNPRWEELSGGHKESGLLDAGADPAKKKTLTTIASLLRQLVVYHFQDTSKEARIKARWNVSDSIWLKHDAANLGPFLLALRVNWPKHYRRIVETIRQVAPFFDDFVLEPEGGTLLLRWRERDSDLIFDAFQASDGTLRTIALITALLQPQEKLPALLIIDEPELGLHPYAITIIGGLINAVAQNRQVLIATQSPMLLDQFAPGDVVVVERNGRKSAYRRESEDRLRDWLQEYSMSELWQKNVLGGRPKEEHYDSTPHGR